MLLEYIDAHLNDELTVERLGGVSAISKYHFHRMFSALFGIGVCRYVRLRRLKRAVYQLAFRSHCTVLDVALANGYDAPESFSRAFRRSVGQAPSDFRRQPRWEAWCAIYEPLSQMRIEHMKPPNERVRIELFPETKVAVLEHRGDPRRLGDSIRRFIEWRRENRVPPSVSATFNIVYNDLERVDPEDFRFGLCAAVDKDVEDNRYGVVAGTIPGGRCAVLRHVGSDDTIGEAARYLYQEWLPRSGEEPRDFPLFFQRIEFFPDVAESDAVTDVFLPLK